MDCRAITETISQIVEKVSGMNFIIQNTTQPGLNKFISLNKNVFYSQSVVPAKEIMKNVGFILYPSFPRKRLCKK
jgi:hypothetical protein